MINLSLDHSFFSIYVKFACSPFMRHPLSPQRLQTGYFRVIFICHRVGLNLAHFRRRYWSRNDVMLLAGDVVTLPRANDPNWLDM